MESLRKLKDAVAAAAAQVAITRDTFTAKILDYEMQLKESTEALEKAVAELKAIVDEITASGGPSTP